LYEGNLYSFVDPECSRLKKIIDVGGLDHVLVVAPPPEVFALGDTPRTGTPDPPIDELQEPAPEQEPSPLSALNFHDLFKAGGGGREA
jgi:hypothetical protein